MISIRLRRLYLRLSHLIGGGCGQKLGLFSRHKAEVFTIFDRAFTTKGHLDTSFVIPTDVGVDLVNKLGHGECPPTVIGIEACGTQHYWARLLTGCGHELKIIAPQLAKPYVTRGKNDAADAEALCEAMSRPKMMFVPVKSAEQQAALLLVGIRERAVAARTQLANTIRSYAAEFGVTAAKGVSHIPRLL